MLDWLAVGNAWRNLYLLSSIVQALALGLWFAKRRLWVKRSRLGAFLAGVSITPLIQYLWTLLLALLWPHAPKLVYIGVLPVVAGAYLFVTGLLHLRHVRALGTRLGHWLTGLIRLDKPAVVSLCFALAMGVLLMPIVIRLGTSTSAIQADAGEYMGLGLRYCEDRDLGALLDKDDQTGHYRGHSHFPSMELYMAYGLMHTGDNYGYPYDKPMLTGLGLLTFYLLAGFAALLIQLAHGKRRWILLGLLLFNLVPNYVYSLSIAVRDNWRCLALVVAAVALIGLHPTGCWRRYLGKFAFVALLGFTVMSTHVVCFVVFPFMVAAWVVLRWLESLYRRDRQAGRTLLRAIGLALGGAAGTLAAYAGNLWCYVKWGEMSPWRLMTTYTGAPWYAAYMQGEYKLEATTTHLDFWQAKYDIVMAYATPVGIWGLRLAILGLLAVITLLVVRRAKARNVLRECKADAKYQDGPVAVVLQDCPVAKARTERMIMVLAASLMTLFTLAPMSGLLDTSMYSFSGSFLTMQRYTLQWYLFAIGTIVTVLAALEAEWAGLVAWIGRVLGKTSAALRARLLKSGLIARQIPAWFCVLLCALSFATGTKESGYTNSFYRYGRPMLTDELYSLDTSYRLRYDLLTQLRAVTPTQEKIIITRPGYQYALRSRGYLLTSNPIVPLMNLTVEQVPEMLAQMNVAALCTEPAFWDERYYAQSTLSAYLNTLPAEQIVQDGYMRVYLLDKSLVGKLTVQPTVQ